MRVTWNLPNALTLARLAAVPVVGVLLFLQTPLTRDFAAVLFVAAAITDFVDGAIARKRGITTDFGALLDPIADKALITVALVGLSALGDVPWWVTIVILVREFGVTALRLAVLRRGVIPASRGGKAKTLAQIIAIAMFLAVGPPWWVTIASVVMGIAVVLTVV
ncbi:MAG: CDP-diacylglycerol--glycerol-3-phosphate 3-phosphatidyltransferase, partial [Actinomycetota bacterium]|nr:CDP-diacylglycerol--glycerol-3-phosphate 3-phosphatidyltransferase [Actinomycetota bacterium]